MFLWKNKLYYLLFFFRENVFSKRLSSFGKNVLVPVIAQLEAKLVSFGQKEKRGYPA